MKFVAHAETQPETPTWRCPCCDKGVFRISRHTRDRLLSWLHPVWRYRCRDSLCAWEGTVRVSQLSERQRHAHAQRPDKLLPAAPAKFVVTTSSRPC